jgi:hypothetical protein
VTTEGVERGSAAASSLGPDPSWSGLYRTGAVSAGPLKCCSTILMHLLSLSVRYLRE